MRRRSDHLPTSRAYAISSGERRADLHRAAPQRPPTGSARGGGQKARHEHEVPNVPTMAECGSTESRTYWAGVVAPAGTPPKANESQRRAKSRARVPTGSGKRGPDWGANGGTQFARRL